MARRLMDGPLVDARDYLRSQPADHPPEVITDLNMVNEFRHGKSPLFGWLKPILPASPYGADD